MNATSIKPFYIIGIAIRTTNENEQSAKDIPLLWNKFMTENISMQIPDKISEEIYCVYTDYDLDYTKPYMTLIGCNVANLNTIPDGFTGKAIEGGRFAIFTAKGKLSDNIVIQEWQKIWNSGMKRSYKADFEVYGEKAQNPENAEVDIFISVD